MSRFVAAAIVGLGALYAAVPAGAEVKPYLLRLADHVAAWRPVLVPMKESADRAAHGVLQGGQLYTFGPQPGFASEAQGRAGGLMLLQRYKLNTMLTERDTVLAAITQVGDATELEELQAKVRQAGAQLILFGRSDLPGVTMYDVSVASDLPEQISTESVIHVVGMWAWTGQFISACVERGKMPCVYQSYMLPGGRERAAYLKQHDNGRFHAATSVCKEDTAAIATTYLNIVGQSLRQTWAMNHDVLQRSADLLCAAHTNGLPVAVFTEGHLFPAELKHLQEPNWIVAVMNDETMQGRYSAAIVLEYQSTPWKRLEALGDLGIPVIWTCSQPAMRDLTIIANHVYIDPHWPITDAVVELTGYDVKLLPASGVLDSAVYWQVVELTRLASFMESATAVPGETRQP